MRITPIAVSSGHFVSAAFLVLNPNHPIIKDAIRTIAAEARSSSWCLGYMPGTIDM